MSIFEAPGYTGRSVLAGTSLVAATLAAGLADCPCCADDELLDPQPANVATHSAIRAARTEGLSCPGFFGFTFTLHRMAVAAAPVASVDSQDDSRRPYAGRAAVPETLSSVEVSAGV
jgi:hypothetical protein